MSYRNLLPILFATLLFGVVRSPYDVWAQSKSEALPIVAWVSTNQLWASDSNGDVKLLVSEDVQSAALSPDRTQIVYSTGDTLAVMAIDSGEMVATLSADVFPTNPEIADSAPRFATPYWVADSTLWFNTIDIFTSAYGYENRYDVQQWDILENELIEIASPGEGGILFPSPDHSKVAIYRPGHYQDLSNPAVIEIMDVNTGTVLGDSITFPSVATGSEVNWYPNITWSGSSDAIGFSIPDPDLLYFAPADTPPTQVCILTILGEMQCQWPTLTFPAQPNFNADLSIWAALQPDESGWALIIGVASDENLETPTVLSRNLLFAEWVNSISIDLIDWTNNSRLLARITLDSRQTQILSIDITSGSSILWPDVATSSQIINLQPLENSLYAIAYGDFSNTRVLIYDVVAQTSTPLLLPSSTETMGWIAFALR